jgi:hypothetical protein
LDKQLRFKFEFHAASDEKISNKLDRVALEEAIKRLLENVALFYDKDQREQNYRVVKIAVRLRGGESSTGLQVAQSPTPQPATSVVAQAPALAQTPRPEPFQFTFNP